MIRRRFLPIALALVVLWLPGCLSSGSRLFWSPPPILHFAAENGEPSPLQQAAQADEARDRSAPELYLAAALDAWDRMRSASAKRNCQGTAAATFEYHACVARLLETASEHGLWRPGEGIDIDTHQGAVWIPIETVGFAWRRDEFHEIHVVGDYASPSLTRRRQSPGFGVPVVILRNETAPLRAGDQYLPQTSAFAATAILRPVSRENGTIAATLEFWNPLQTAEVPGHSEMERMAADVSASLVYGEIERNQAFDPFEMFIRPDNNPAFEGLTFLEPYQPGKIPIVFVHGLLSSPGTWIDMVNDLRADPEFNSRYQIWAFGYATGKPFIRSAAELRRELNCVLNELATCGDDPALREVVLVGHSMGGLISKLMVAQSGDALWNAFAYQPFDSIEMPDDLRERARGMFFFEPIPHVRKVIFIGTPHRGAALATRCVGRVGSALVRRNPDELSKVRDVLANNRGAFRLSLRQRLPTSIDMLEPSDRMLRAIDELPLSDRTHLHTIAGDGVITVGALCGDGVVPLRSAVHPLAETELLVKASHTQVHRRPESVSEVLRILNDKPFEAAGLDQSR